MHMHMQAKNESVKDSQKYTYNCKRALTRRGKGRTEQTDTHANTHTETEHSAHGCAMYVWHFYYFLETEAR